MIDLQRYFVLLALSQGRLHGIGVQEQMMRDSRDGLVLRLNSVHRLLHDLEKRKYVEPAGEEPGLGGREGMRRLYQLTDAGRRVLRAQSRDLQEAGSLGLKRLWG